jgi:hypothetical protein
MSPLVTGPLVPAGHLPSGHQPSGRLPFGDPPLQRGGGPTPWRGTARPGNRHRGRAGDERIAGDQCINGLADAPARSVQQHALVLRGDTEQRADLLRLTALHVAQHDHRALTCGQPLDRVLHVGPELPAGDHPLRVELVPQARRVDPVAVGLELGHVHRPLAALGAVQDAGQSDQARLAAGTAARAVQHDGEQPGGQAGAALEAADPVEHGQPGVLHDLLGLGAAADDGVGNGDQGRMEPTNHRPIGAGSPARNRVRKAGSSNSPVRMRLRAFPHSCASTRQSRVG